MSVSQFAAKGMYCQVCNVALSGPEPARQHYDSQKHKRRAMMGAGNMAPTTAVTSMAERLAVGPTQFTSPRASPPCGVSSNNPNQLAAQILPGNQMSSTVNNVGNQEECIATDCDYPGCYYHCQVCEKHISGPGEDNKKQHLAGTVHAKMLQRKGMPHVSSQPTMAVPGGYAYSPIQSEPGNSNVSSASNLLSTSQTPQMAGSPVTALNLPVTTALNLPTTSNHTESIPEEAYSFDNVSGRGVCYICNNLQFTSREHAGQHLNGDKHRKMKMRWEAMKGKSLDVSGVPRVAPPAAFNVTGLTLNGSGTSASPLLQTATDRMSALSLINNQKQNPPGMVAMNTNLLPVTTAQTQMDFDEIDKTIWYDCPVCRKRVNSPEQLRIHLMSHPGNYTQMSSGTLNYRDVAGGFGMASNLDGIDIVPKDQTINGHPHIGNNESSAGNLISKPAVQEFMARTLGSGMVTAQPSIPSSLFSTGEPSIPVKEDMQGHFIGVNTPAVEAPPVSVTVSPDRASYGIPARGADPIGSPEDAITTGICPFPGCYYHCTVCEQHISGEENKVQHLRGRPHEKNMKKRALPTTINDTYGNVGMNMVQGFECFCYVCQVPFNEDSYDAHMKGKKHLGNAAKSQAVPLRNLPPVHKVVGSDQCSSQAYELTSTAPRSYQVELFEKAMEGDTVIFLPTGTGKTLISCMVMSYMLKINARRPVVFLVDKVLLVIQQSKVIQKELGGTEFSRWDESSGGMKKRPLRIAAICGDKTDTKGLPLWEQDVIVVTADFYKNLLETDILRWSDSCLVVFDESHHCTKTHPFNVLLKNYHSRLPQAERPKILGLTASPAGQETVPKTKEMLHKLLRNMGDGHMAMVEEYHNELLKHQSCTKLIPKEVSHSAEEKDLRSALQDYVMNCYLRLDAISNLSQLPVSTMLRGISSTNQNLCGDIVDELIMALGQVKPRIVGQHVDVEVLKVHLGVVCEALRSIDEIGLGGAFQTLDILIQDNVLGNFAQAKQLELKCTALERLVIELARKRQQTLDAHLTDMCSDPDLMPAVQQLISEILDNLNWNTPTKPIALVLVQKRQDAHTLAKILQENPSLLQRGIQTVCLVGHGSGGGDGGMAVNKQERILSEIKSGKHQIVVATSVAEEGVDMPACELVVQMDPPNNVRALVQLRGRARKKNSIFVALCRSQEQKNVIEDLLLREENMKVAVADLIKEQRGEETASNSMDFSLSAVLGSKCRDTMM